MAELNKQARVTEEIDDETTQTYGGPEYYTKSNW